jgi:acyl-CoA thioester hydrolase
MEKILIPLQVRWADVDANRHLRHSVYYDFGAYCRMSVFTDLDITTKRLEDEKLGPILLREEAVFRREVVFGDKLLITIETTRAAPDYSRWSFRHTISKEDGTLCSVLTVDGAWIDTVKRKLVTPGEFIQRMLASLPRSPDFETVIREKR